MSRYRSLRVATPRSSSALLPRFSLRLAVEAGLRNSGARNRSPCCAYHAEPRNSLPRILTLLPNQKQHKEPTQQTSRDRILTCGQDSDFVTKPYAMYSNRILTRGNRSRHCFMESVATETRLFNYVAEVAKSPHSRARRY